MPRRHLLIGSGPAAIAAAETIRSHDHAAEIVIVSADPDGYYSRPGLAYYLTKELPEKRLFPLTPQELAGLKLQWLTARAVAVAPERHRVTLEGGRELPYDRLLIATGSTAIAASCPGAHLDGVVKLDDMDDARNLLERCHTARAAVVVGGGITALEIVEGLQAHGVRVHYLMRKDRYWSNVLSELESRLVERALRGRGVEIHDFSELGQILGRDGRVVAVETTSGTRIPCDIVAVAIGVRPQKELAATAGLECGRGILVDEHLRSSNPHIFAAGDVAEAYEPLTRRRTIEVLWGSAVAKGRIAGLNMVTEALDSYDKRAPLNVTRLAGFKITIIGTVGHGKDADLPGVARGDSETWRELGEATIVESHGNDAHVRLALGERTIVGAVAMGNQSISFPLQDLIEARADVSDIATRLQAPGAPVAEIVTAHWQDWKAQRV